MKLLNRFVRNRSDRLPIFILGVPRSGTTLLRTILDSHATIACGPETPWLAAHQPRSVMALQQYLVENPLGYCRSFGMPPEVVMKAARRFVVALMDAYARSKGKRRWAEKTPDNLMHLEFLAEMFPSAAYIHIVRDALDTAISTSIISPHRRGISDWHEKFLLIGPECQLENNPFNAVLRWNHWNRRVDEVLAGRRVLRASYEDLVRNPAGVLRSVFHFIEERFDASVLDYARFEHDLPDWEWGSADVKRFEGITAERTGRAYKELSATEREVLLPIALYGREQGELFTGEVQAATASADDIQSEKFKLLIEYFDSFARPLGLAPLEEGEKWEYPWLWLHAFQNIDWRGKKVIFAGREASPLPWMLSLMGASVVLLSNSSDRAAACGELREKLRVQLECRAADLPVIPLPAEHADVLIWTVPALQSAVKRTASTESARVLKRQGILALTFAYSDGRGNDAKAGEEAASFTLKEFEGQFWFNPAFGGTTPPNWNRNHSPAIEHGTETLKQLAAAVLRKV